MGLELYAKIEEYLDFTEPTQRLHDFFYEIVNEINPSTLLDIGCGQGDFLKNLNSNIKSFGIDLSHNQVQIAKSKGIDADVLDISQLKQTFDMQTAIFDVLNYINPNDLRIFLQNCYNNLNPKGYLVFDINTLFGFEDIAQGSIIIDKEDLFIGIDAYFEDEILSTHLTLFTKQNDTSYTKEQDTIKQYFHSNETIKKLLKQIGFHTEKILNIKLHSFSKPDKSIWICSKQ